MPQLALTEVCNQLLVRWRHLLEKRGLRPPAFLLQARLSVFLMPGPPLSQRRSRNAATEVYNACVAEFLVQLYPSQPLPDIVIHDDILIEMMPMIHTPQDLRDTLR